MKNISIVVFFLLFCGFASAQAPVGSPIVPFNITLHDGSPYTAADLPKNKPVILVYFAPDCDHCSRFAKELTAHAAALQGKQVLMISYFPLPAIIDFNKNYGISSHTGMKIGTEGTAFIVRKYYNIMRFPFIVLYNSKGKEVKRFTEDMPFQTLLEAFTALQ